MTIRNLAAVCLILIATTMCVMMGVISVVSALNHLQIHVTVDSIERINLLPVRRP